MKVLGKILSGTAAALCVAHTCEWFLEGRQVAAAAGIPVKEALPQCLLRGFLWWKPLKQQLAEK